jgi:serine/threonine-protein kinase
MAEIFLATNESIEGFSKTVVVKRILPHLASEPEFIRMFVDEAKLVATLSHPNIVQVYELGVINGRHFITMEYISGIDLATLTKRIWATGKPFPPSAALAILIATLLGLDYAHEKKNADGVSLELVHRDISPHNIMLSDDGLVKILDFGIAKIAGFTTRTQSGVVKGKIAYMAPEQVMARPLDRRTDLFAAALVGYELFTGRKAYQAENEFLTFEQARDAKLAPIAQIVPGFPERLSRIFTKALAADINARHATCGELARELMEAGSALGSVDGATSITVLLRAYREPLPDEVKSESSLHFSDDEALPQDSSRGGGGTGATEPLPAPEAPPPRRRGALIGAVVAASLAVWFLAKGAHWLSPRERVPPAVAASLSVAASSPSAAASEPAVVEAVPANDGVGYLSINSSPWSYIYIDGKKLEKPTPVQRYRLAAGAHKVRLESPGAGHSQEFTVMIRAGRQERKVVNFR